MSSAPSATMLDRVAAELGLGLTPALRDQVAQEQLRMVLTHTRVGTMAATLFAVLAAWHFRGLVPSWQVDAWIVAKLLVAAARIGLAQGFGRWRERTLASGDAQVAAERGLSRRWLRWTLLLLAIDGVVWGVAAYRMMGEAQTTAVLVMAAVDAVTCVATFGLQAHLPSTIAYVAPMLLASALGLAQRGDDIALITAFCQLILLALQLSTAHGTTRRLSAGFLLRLNAQQLVAEKDAALALAQQQSALRVQFLAKISHELRTPLHGILGLARLLHLESADPQVTRQVELIESSGTHLLGLINDLLDVSRTESGRFSLRIERFELRQEIEQVAEVFALRAADRGLAFHWHADLPSPHWVRGDAARLRQVLHNLLGNAVKFTRAGKVSLDVTLAGEDTVRLTVRDTGPGIGEAEQARIFQPFHQAERAGSAPTDGVGLGLTIAREIAQAMGGDITLDSRPGAGACFVFSARLPAAPALPSSVSAAAAAAETGGQLPSRVLVAEDDDVNALIVCGYLERLGIAHERVADGKQAVGRALRDTDRPERVLMDCRMPVMDGLAATREIRTQERTLNLARVPIIALTATLTDTDRLACLAAGMDHVIGKPFSLEQLMQALRGPAG
jgi:signal transduction histidine kinase